MLFYEADVARNCARLVPSANFEQLRCRYVQNAVLLSLENVLNLIYMVIATTSFGLVDHRKLADVDSKNRPDMTFAVDWALKAN